MLENTNQYRNPTYMCNQTQTQGPKDHESNVSACGYEELDERRLH